MRATSGKYGIRTGLRWATKTGRRAITGQNVDFLQKCSRDASKSYSLARISSGLGNLLLGGKRKKEIFGFYFSVFVFSSLTLRRGEVLLLSRFWLDGL